MPTIPKKKRQIQTTKPIWSGGFTLVEILVSVALFSMVMVVALGALLSMSVSVRKAESINSAVNNIAASMDSMSRSIRIGTGYHCGSPAGQDCRNSPSSFFSYTAFGGVVTNYCLSESDASPLTCLATNTCTTGKSCVVIRSTGGAAYVMLTSPEVQINYLGFYVVGSNRASAPDTEQPKTIIILSGIVPISPTASTTFNLQTAVTQRIYDQ